MEGSGQDLAASPAGPRKHGSTHVSHPQALSVCGKAGYS